MLQAPVMDHSSTVPVEVLPLVMFLGFLFLVWMLSFFMARGRGTLTFIRFGIININITELLPTHVLLSCLRAVAHAKHLKSLSFTKCYFSLQQALAGRCIRLTAKAFPQILFFPLFPIFLFLIY